MLKKRKVMPITGQICNPETIGSSLRILMATKTACMTINRNAFIFAIVAGLTWLAIITKDLASPVSYVIMAPLTIANFAVTLSNKHTISVINKLAGALNTRPFEVFQVFMKTDDTPDENLRRYIMRSVVWFFIVDFILISLAAGTILIVATYLKLWFSI